MQCKEVRNQFTDYLSDTLTEPVRLEVEKHLSSCSACRQEVEELEVIWMKLGSIPAEMADSAGMRAKFDVMLQAYKQGLEHSSPRLWDSMNAWVTRWWPQQPLLQFGLALALIVVGVFLGQNRPAVAPPSPEIGQLRQELHDMRQMVALSLLQQQSASERLKGVSWSNQLDQPGAEVLSALLDTLMHDPNVNVRLASIDALKKFGAQQSVRRGVLQALEEQESPLVQIALIDLVVEIQAKESLDTLRKLTANTALHEAVRKRAEWGIERLSQG
jgi:HEAT repeats/Putative zinc-finger